MSLSFVPDRFFLLFWGITPVLCPETKHVWEPNFIKLFIYQYKFLLTDTLIKRYSFSTVRHTNVSRFSLEVFFFWYQQVVLCTRSFYFSFYNNSKNFQNNALAHHLLAKILFFSFHRSI
jgi:hypothetical protein